MVADLPLGGTTEGAIHIDPESRQQFITNCRLDDNRMCQRQFVV